MNIILPALFSGLILGLSQPLVLGFLKPTPIDPSGLSGLLAFIGFVPAMLAANNAKPKSAFVLGFLSSGVQYIVIYYWVVIAMTVFGGVGLSLSLCGIS